MDKTVENQLYVQVWEEVARQEYQPGLIARAVAEARGNRDVAQSLYIKYRFEELAHQVERNIEERAARVAKEQLEKLKKDKLAGVFTCWNCSFRGKPLIKKRGNDPTYVWLDFLVGLLLLCAFVIPGAIYLGWVASIKYYFCPKCGAKLRKQ